MTYVDTHLHGNTVFVSERSKDGIRVIKKYAAPYYLYIEDEDGPYVSMYGNKLSRVDFSSGKELRDGRAYYNRLGTITFESDVRPEHRILEREYAHEEIHPIHVTFVDIEVDKDKARGWARPDNPYAEITAITIHRSWHNDLITLAIPPKNMSRKEAEMLVEDIPNTFVLDTEADMLAAFVNLIEDTDLTSGWNSEFFDWPYLIARIRMVLGGEPMEAVIEPESKIADSSMQWLKKLCLFGAFPKFNEVDKFGALEITYSFPGKPHIDYLGLYRKFTQEEKFSYKLDNILRDEVKLSKVEYEGTLDDLYYNDFRLYVEYNRQDVNGLVELDRAKRYIDLAVSMSHMACVQIPQVLGSVAIIEQAMLLELHARGQIASDKPGVSSDGDSIAGAFVALPTAGIYDWVASFDIKSLYPSTIRLLNISPETLVGQFDISGTMNTIDDLVRSGECETKTEAWGRYTGVQEFHDISDNGGDPDKSLTLVLESGEAISQTGREWNKFFRENNLCLSGNGTVFTLDFQGIIPYCMEKWFNERIEFQKQAKSLYRDLNDITEDDPGYDELKVEQEYYDRLQNVKKLFLNSSYGATLNPGFRFYDQRMGQSITLSGRNITKHMIRKLGEILKGTYEFIKEFITSDTDSAYVTVSFLMDHLKETTGKKEEDLIDELISLIDTISIELNESFPPKLRDIFFLDDERGKVIIANREIVARRGLFKGAKKRYALSVIDIEGVRKSFLKIMGMETKRTDTPRFIQVFLESMIEGVIADDLPYEEIVQKVRTFVDDVFRKRNPWENGSPCRVSNITNLSRLRIMFEEGFDPDTETMTKIDNPRIHFSVIAGDNTNRYIKYHEETGMDVIREGDKVEVIHLFQDPKLNPLNFKTVARPVDATFIPEWFQQLPFDMFVAEEKLIYKKLDNIFGELGWDFRPPKTHADDVFG